MFFNFAKDFWHIVFGLCIGASLALGAIKIGPSILYHNVPIVDNMRAVASFHRGDYVDVKIIGDKNLDCGPPIAVQASLTALSGDTAMSVTFLDDATLDTNNKILEVKQPDSNPVGENIDFGWWRFKPDVQGLVLMKVYHRCFDDQIFESVFTLDLTGEKRYLSDG